MKMAAMPRLLALTAWAALAVARGTPPEASKAAGDLPVPEGWHIVEFTSPKAGSADAAPISLKGAASTLADQGKVLAPELAALNKLTAEQESEANARAAKQVAPEDSGDMLANALGSVQETEASAATSEVQPPPASTNAGGSDIDGLQIPAGYRIEGYTPAAAAVASPKPAESQTPAPVLQAADAVPDASTPTTEDGLPQTASASLADGTTGGEALALKKAGVAPQPAATSVAEGGATGELKVDGLAVPAGWKITAVLDDDDAPAQSEEPPPTPPAKVSPVAKAKVVATPAVTSAAISVSEVHAPAKPTPVGVAAVATAPASAAVAEPVQQEMERPKAWSQDMDEQSAFSGVGPVAADETASAMAEMGVQSTAQTVVSTFLHYVRGDQQPDLMQPRLPPSATLGHITSVECLTETIDNGGRPCGSQQLQSFQVRPAAEQPQVQAKEQAQVQAKPAEEQPQVQATPVVEQPQAQAKSAAEQTQVQAMPAVRKPLLTKASAHTQKSITQVSAAEAPPAETRTHLRAGHPAKVDIVTAVEDEQVKPKVHTISKVVLHERHPRHEEAQEQTPEEVEAPSMADLIAQRGAA